MRVSDQNLLPPTASSTAQNATSRRVKDNGKDDGGFNDVYSQTAAARRRQDDKASVQSDQRAATKSTDSNKKPDNTKTETTAVNDNGAPESKPAKDGDIGAKSGKAETNASLIKALATGEKLDDAQLAALAEELGLSAEDLAEALKKLAENTDTIVADQAATQETPANDEDSLGLLFRLLLGHNKKTDADQKSDEVSADDGKNSDDSEADGALENVSADDIASLLNALTDVSRSESKTKDDGAASATTFRFERVDGKGTPVELQLGNAKDGLSLEAADGAAAKTENVTVLDVRRYLAPTDMNATNVLNAMTGDKDWASAMKAASGAHLPTAVPEKIVTEVNTLKIQMHPVDLGTVTATLRLKGDDLVVSMNVQTAEAYHQLTLDKDKILNSLKSQGYSVDQINVQFTPADRGVQQSASSQQQQDGQQFAGGGGAAGQEQQDGNRRQGTNGTSAAFGIDEVAAAGIDSDSGSSADGQLYL